jgi:hypothetical protein
VRSFKGWKEGKAGYRLVTNLYQSTKFVHARMVYINANGTLKDTGRTVLYTIFTATK